MGVPASGLVEGVERIAVLRANALGDYIATLPALYALRAAYPQAEIVLLGAPWHARFLTGRPGPVDRVLVVPALDGIREPEPGETPLDLDRFLADTRRERFDLAVQLHGGGRNSNPIVNGLGARVSAGLRAPDAEPLDPLPVPAAGGVPLSRSGGPGGRRTGHVRPASDGHRRRPGAGA